MAKKRKIIVTAAVILTVLFVASAVLVITLAATTRLVTVEGMSMMYTLREGDKVITSNLNYEPASGDIVVLDLDEFDGYLVKRIIATEGQTVKIDFEKWEVYVDGVLLKENYVYGSDCGVDMSGAYKYDGKITVPEGQIYVMGDYRNISLDSRDFGCVDEQTIVGKVIYVIQAE